MQRQALKQRPAEASRGQARAAGRPASVASQVFSFQGGQNSMKSSETIRGSLPGRHSGSQPSASCTTVAFIMHQPASSWLLAHASPLINHDANRQAANMCNEYSSTMGRRIIVNNALASLLTITIMHIVRFVIGWFAKTQKVFAIRSTFVSQRPGTKEGEVRWVN